MWKLLHLAHSWYKQQLHILTCECELNAALNISSIKWPFLILFLIKLSMAFFRFAVEWRISNTNKSTTCKERVTKTYKYTAAPATDREVFGRYKTANDVINCSGIVVKLRGVEYKTLCKIILFSSVRTACLFVRNFYSSVQTADQTVQIIYSPIRTVRQTIHMLQGPFINHSSSVCFSRSNGFPLVSVLPFRVTNV